MRSSRSSCWLAPTWHHSHAVALYSLVSALLIYVLKCCASWQELEPVLFQSYMTTAGGLWKTTIALRSLPGEKSTLVLLAIRIRFQNLGEISGVAAIINHNKHKTWSVPGPLRECRSIGWDVSVLPCCCASVTCVPDVMRGLAVRCL